MVYIIGLFNLIISIKSITDPDYGWHISVGKYKCDITKTPF